MNGHLGILISCVFYVVIIESECVQVLKPEIERYSDDGVSQVKFFGNSQGSNSNGTRRVDSTVYQTVNKYYCSLDSIIEGGLMPIKLICVANVSNLLDARRTGIVDMVTLGGVLCPAVDVFNGSHLMVYGSNGWTFPVQDVNLTLRYPPEDRAAQHFEFIFNGENMTADDEDYVITGFKVILFIDGPDSEGFINEGGVLQEHISLSFISSHLTSLSYEFWLYGVRNTPSVADIYSHYRLC